MPATAAPSATAAGATAPKAATTATSAGAVPSRGSDVVSAKVVLLGDSAVGKSSLALRFARNEFHANQETTIGAAFLSRTVHVASPPPPQQQQPQSQSPPPSSPAAAAGTTTRGDTATRPLKLEIWDTAGQERYRSLAPIYYRGARGALVVYDITSRDSLDKARSWLHELRASAEPSLVVVLVGNKVDLDAARQVSLSEAQTMVAAEGVVGVYETSAKDGRQVEDAFTALACAIAAQDVSNSSKGSSSSSSGGGGVRSARVLGATSTPADANATARSMCCM